MQIINAKVAEFRRLYAEYKKAGVDAFHCLMQWEDDEASWKGSKEEGTGFASFSDLMFAFDFPEYHRLANFRAGLEHLHGDLEVARKMGLDAVCVFQDIPEKAPSRRYPDKTAIECMKQDMLDSFEERGVQISGRQAHTIKAKHYEPPRETSERPAAYADRLTAAEAKAKELERLLREATRLVAKKDREIAALTAKLEKAEAKLTTARAVACSRKSVGRSQSANAAAD